MLEIFIPRDKAWVPILEILPLFGMYRGLHELAQYAFLGMYQGGDGLTWERMSDDGNGMGRVMGIFVLEFFVFTLLAWYLEQVLDDTTGVRRHWLFFLDPWRNRQAGGALPGLDGSDAKASEEELLGDSEEVRAERQRVYGLDAADFSDHVVIAKDLRKVRLLRFHALGHDEGKLAPSHAWRVHALLPPTRGECRCFPPRARPHPRWL